MARRKRKKFSCDFETTTDPNDCRVWAYGWMEIGNEENTQIGNNLSEFMRWLEKIKADCYFHNLRFDGSFIVNWLLKNGWKHDPDGDGGRKTFTTIISKMNQWYMIDLCYGYSGDFKLHTVLYDSLKKLPFKVAEIAKGFKMDMLKGDIDYHEYRPENHNITDEEKLYINNDIGIVANALKTQFDQGLENMTIGSDAMRDFKGTISKKLYQKYFPDLSVEMYEELKHAYRGGFTWLNDRFKEKEIGEGLVYDVNSLYPSQMFSRPLPYGMPEFFEGQYGEDEKYPLYIQHIRCGFDIKEGHIPTIQIKRNREVRLLFKPNEYLKNSKGEVVDLYLTNMDLELFLEHYEPWELEYIDGWKFQSKTGFFEDYIKKWTLVKTTSEGAIKLLAKLMLNNLYGKFATNPEVTGKVPVLNEDGSCSYKIADEKEYKDQAVYLPMGAFITSWARYTTITTAQKCYGRIIYCDTDSIHLTGTETPEPIKDLIDDKKLGYWAHEGTFRRAKYIRQKTYLDELIVKPYYKVDHFHGRVIETNVKVSVKCAGMPDNIKKKVTFGNFKVGFKSKGKLVPRQVDGGVVLEDREFTLKG